MPDPTASPFDDIRRLAAGGPEPDLADAQAVRLRLARAAPGGLGRAGRLANWASSAQGRGTPVCNRPLVCVFAASHGVGARLGGRDEIAAIRARLDAFAAGATATNAACAVNGIGFKAFDLALDLPTGDIAREPAMSERDCVATMAFGMEAIAGGTDVLAVGHVGPGAAVAAAAILCALAGDPPATWAPSGREALDAVTEAVLRHGRETDPLTVLASLGGRDVAAIAGAILAARTERVPVLLDGVAAAAAAAVLHALAPRALEHCLVACQSPEPAYAALESRLGLEPILTGFDVPDGEGLGAALALGLVKTAIACAKEPAVELVTRR